MGQEFCNGCQDCTNFKDFESNFSLFGNQPITHLNNPSYENGNLDNSIFNIKTEYPSETSVFSNNNENQNPQNNETSRILSLSSKQASNDLNFNQLINIDTIQKGEIRDKDNNNFFENNFNYKDNSLNKYNIDDKSKKETSVNSNEYKIFSSDLNKSLEKEINNNGGGYLDEEDKKRLDKILKNYKAKKITILFKQFMEKKSISHQILCTENASINDYQNIQNNLRTDLTVNLIPEKNYIYIGTKFNGKKDGLGLELFTNTNAKFFGRFINDKRVSIGRFIINNEDDSYYYFGYVNGIHAEGFGWHENMKKSIYYEGMWLNSKKDGFGIERNNRDNSEYRGCFKNGKKNGIGYYQWSDDSYYLGEWEDDNLDGYGIYHFQDGSIYTGHFKHNKMNGLGEFTFPEIKSYFGFFENDQRVGFGIMIWYKESKVFMGFWNDNKQHGPGKIINKGKIKYGVWENGNLKEKIKIKEHFINILEKEKCDYMNFFMLDDYNEISQKILKILKI